VLPKGARTLSAPAPGPYNAAAIGANRCATCRLPCPETSACCRLLRSASRGASPPRLTRPQGVAVTLRCVKEKTSWSVGGTLRLALKTDHAWEQTRSWPSICGNARGFKAWLQRRPQLLRRLERRHLGAAIAATEDETLHRMRDHAVMVGCGRVGEAIARAPNVWELPFVVLERDRRRVEDLHAGGMHQFKRGIVGVAARYPPFCNYAPEPLTPPPAAAARPCKDRDRGRRPRRAGC
jgi:hypothetical protein